MARKLPRRKSVCRCLGFGSSFIREVSKLRARSTWYTVNYGRNNKYRQPETQRQPHRARSEPICSASSYRFVLCCLVYECQESIVGSTSDDLLRKH